MSVDRVRRARQAMEVGKLHAALAALAGGQHARLEGGERDAHVRGVRGDAMLARPQDRVHAVDPVDRRTAAARFALVAWRGRIVEIEAARTGDRKSTRLNSSHRCISYAVFCLKKKTKQRIITL